MEVLCLKNRENNSFLFEFWLIYSFFFFFSFGFGIGNKIHVLNVNEVKNGFLVIENVLFFILSIRSVSD